MRFKSLVATLLMIFILPPAARAENFQQNRSGKGRRLWKISAAILGVATIADMQSSVGRRELNPMLRGADGRFSTRGVSIKAAIVGGALAGQHLMLRKHPEACGWAAGANFAGATATSAVITRNHMR